MYSLDEIGLLPSSNPVNINSRQECCPFNEDGNLPIFVAPMTSVLDFSNYEKFKTLERYSNYSKKIGKFER